MTFCKRAFNKVPVRFIKGFWQQKLVAVYELTGIGGLFFSWEEKNIYAMVQT